MSNKLPYFRWHPKDFETDQNVKLMTMCEVGLYVMCLNHAWINGSLPNDVKKIAKIVGQPLAQVKKSWPAVAKCFEENPQSNLVNPKQEKERTWAQERHVKAKEANTIRNKSVPNQEGEHLEKDEALRAYGSGSVSGSGSDLETASTEKTSSRAREKIDSTTQMGLWCKRRGFKKPPRSQRERALERMEELDITEQEFIAAMDGYYASDWGQKHGYPLFGFLKNPHSWADLRDCEPSAERTSPQIDSQATQSVSKAPEPQEPAEDAVYAAIWNEKNPDAYYAWDRLAPRARMLECLTEPDFRQNWPEICEMAAKARACRPNAGWITLSWMLKRGRDGENWGWYRMWKDLVWMTVAEKVIPRKQTVQDHNNEVAARLIARYEQEALDAAS